MGSRHIADWVDACHRPANQLASVARTDRSREGYVAKLVRCLWQRVTVEKLTSGNLITRVQIAALTEVEQRVGGPALPHLVIEARKRNVFGLTQTAILLDADFRH